MKETLEDVIKQVRVNDIPIFRLDLSARAYNALKLNGINYLSEFAAMEPEELRKLDLVTPSIAEELAFCAKEYLYTLRRFWKEESQSPEPVASEPEPAPEQTESEEETALPAGNEGDAGTSGEAETAAEETENTIKAEAVDTTAPKPVELDDDRPIEALNLSVRAYNCLKRAKVNTVRQLSTMTAEELLKIRNMGRKSAEEILEILAGLKASAENDASAFDSINDLQDNRPIQELELSTITTSLLLHSGIRTVQALLDCPVEELSKIFSYSSRVKKEITEAIERIQQESSPETTAAPLSEDTPIEELPLSVRSKNCLKWANILTLKQLLEATPDELKNIRKLGLKSLIELLAYRSNYAPSTSTTGKNEYSSDEAKVSPQESELETLSALLADNTPIEDLPLSTRAINCLKRAKIHTVQQLLDTTPDDLLRIKNLGQKSLEELLKFKENYVPVLEPTKLKKAEYTDAELKPLIIKAFSQPFKGLSFQEIKAALPGAAEDSVIKQAVGELLAEGELEYVDYRCYRKYPSFYEYLDTFLSTLPDRDQEVLTRRYSGDTLEAIAQDMALTRERVRQIQSKTQRKVEKTRDSIGAFDEDYYVALYTKCYLPQSFWVEELGLNPRSIGYLQATYKIGSASPETILNDDEIPISLRYRVRSYLDRDKLRIDGVLLPGKRADIEDYAILKYARDEIDFERFSELYNELLETNGIPFDEKLYYSDAVIRTRVNKIADSMLCLWKYGERLRYYDIQARDYTELLETLNLDSYHDTELSTRKFMDLYPELMEKYDIRDAYELHNLLKKIAGQYHLDTVQFGRQPMLKFGEFDRDKVVEEAMILLSPVTIDDLADYLYQEYGYDRKTSIASYFKPIMQYYHQGVYSYNFQRIPDWRIEPFQKALTEDFYFIKEIKDIYMSLFRDADEDDINPRTLKALGFVVNSNYAVQNYSSGEAYFTALLMKDDVYNIRQYAKRYGSIQMFSQVFAGLLRSHQLFRFEKDQIITLRRLERLNVTPELIDDYCAAVQDFVEPGTYFTIESLRQDGFTHQLDDLGFDDYFYGSLLGADERFSAQRVFGTTAVFNDSAHGQFSIAEFIVTQLREYESVDLDEFIQDIKDRYGIVIPNRYEVIYAVRDSELYYDDIMDKIYRDKALYYADIDD